MDGMSYEKTQRNKVLFIIGLIFFMIVSGLIFSTVFTDLSMNDTFNSLYKYFQGDRLTGQEKIVFYMRMPTVLMAVAAGSALAISGAVMQSITHNDLVSPFTLGISSAAAFGASACIVFGGYVMHTTLGMIIGAFGSSLVCIGMVYGLSIYTGGAASNLVLTGIAMNYLFSAMSAVIQFLAQEYKLGEIIQWTFGTLNKATWNTVGITFIVLFVSCVIYYFYALRLDAMAINDDETVKSLGIHPEKVRGIVGLVSVLLTATVISFTGVIGFVGLVAPHIARLIIGNEHKTFLPAAGVIGATLLLYSDMIGKYIMHPVVIPVGIVIAFVGVPIFIHLVIKSREKGM